MRPANVVYLGHAVGQGMIKPIKAKVDAVERIPTPRTRKELQRFLGTVRYYMKFFQNFSAVASPLTNLLANTVKYVWSEITEKLNGFSKIKAILISEPQVGEDEIDHPISYFSKKFDMHQRNYFTIEKECLAFIPELSFQHWIILMYIWVP